MKKYHTIEFKTKLLKEMENATSMADLCARLGMHYNTFRKYAIELGVFKPNQSGKGIKKKIPKIPIQEILSGLHPYYQTNKLRIRLLEEEILEPKCMNCTISQWQGLPVPLELHHEDGNQHNHKFLNLKLLCPNCHAQASTYRGKNVK